jgi:hypothetical protein
MTVYCAWMTAHLEEMISNANRRIGSSQASGTGCYQAVNADSHFDGLPTFRPSGFKEPPVGVARGSGASPILRRFHKRAVQNAIQYFSRCLINAKVLRRFTEGCLYSPVFAIYTVAPGVNYPSLVHQLKVI